MMKQGFSRRQFIRTGLIFCPAAAFAATTVVVPPRSSGVAASPPFTPVGNPNNPNGNGGSHGNKQTRPLAGATIDWGDPITSGLVGCWLCNENGGSTLYDIARSRHAVLTGDTPDNYWGIGTLSGTLASSRDVAIRNTANAYAEVASFSLGSNNLTMMFWAWYNTTAGPWVSGNAAFINKEPGFTNWIMFHDGVTNKIIFRGSGVTNITATKPAEKQFNQICGTINGTSAVLYYNGIPATSGTVGAITDATDKLEFGRLATLGGYQYFGDLGPIYIWNRALSGPEVRDLYDFPYRFIY